MKGISTLFGGFCNRWNEQCKSEDCCSFTRGELESLDEEEEALEKRLEEIRKRKIVLEKK